MGERGISTVIISFPKGVGLRHQQRRGTARHQERRRRNGTSSARSLFEYRWRQWGVERCSTQRRNVKLDVNVNETWNLGAATRSAVTRESVTFSWHRLQAGEPSGVECGWSVVLAWATSLAQRWSTAAVCEVTNCDRQQASASFWGSFFFTLLLLSLAYLVWSWTFSADCIVWQRLLFICWVEVLGEFCLSVAIWSYLLLLNITVLFP
jgi:hypothetical protein